MKTVGIKKSWGTGCTVFLLVNLFFSLVSAWAWASDLSHQAIVEQSQKISSEWNGAKDKVAKFIDQQLHRDEATDLIDDHLLECETVLTDHYLTLLHAAYKAQVPIESVDALINSLGKTHVTWIKRALEDLYSYRAISQQELADYIFTQAEALAQYDLGKIKGSLRKQQNLADKKLEYRTPPFGV